MIFSISSFRCSYGGDHRAYAAAMVADVFSQIYRIRHLGSKLRRVGLLMTLVAGLCYLSQGPTPVHPSLAPPAAFKEQVSSLQSEIGYLRQKLADCDPSSTSFSSLDSLTPIYIVTPTYARPQQKAELTRLKNAFLLVPSVHWIVVEDAPSKTPLVTRYNIARTCCCSQVTRLTVNNKCLARFLAHSGLASTHLAVETPPEVKLNSDDPHWSKPR